MLHKHFTNTHTQSLPGPHRWMGLKTMSVCDAINEPGKQSCVFKAQTVMCDMDALGFGHFIFTWKTARRSHQAASQSRHWFGQSFPLAGEDYCHSLLLTPFFGTEWTDRLRKWIRGGRVGGQPSVILYVVPCWCRKSAAQPNQQCLQPKTIMGRSVAVLLAE